MLLRTYLLLTIVQLAMGQDERPTYSVCEVLSRLSSLHGQVIRVRGVDASTSEGVWIAGTSCSGPETEGQKWKAIIALVAPFEVKDPVAFTFDEASFQRAAYEIQRLQQRLPGRCIEITYTGLIQTREDWSKFRRVYPDGPVRFLGFGHLNEAPAQLIIKSVDAVRAIAGCN